VAESASLVSGIAGRYATALFELAEEENALEAVEKDVLALEEALAESPELRTLVSSPIYSREQQGKAIAAVAEKMELGALTRNILGLMATKRRLFVLSGVISAFRGLLAEKRGEVTAEVTAATKLTDAQTEALSKKLKASVGKDVNLKVAVDETLIGGLIVKVGSRMIDTSIRAKLANLQNAMREVG
jgi:F-type H+-transporting ATPase subunit delta